MVFHGKNSVKSLSNIWSLNRHQVIGLSMRFVSSWKLWRWCDLVFWSPIRIQSKIRLLRRVFLLLLLHHGPYFEWNSKDINYRMGKNVVWRKKIKHLPDGELNPGLPRDRRGYLPLYYRGWYNGRGWNFKLWHFLFIIKGNWFVNYRHYRWQLRISIPL